MTTLANNPKSVGHIDWKIYKKYLYLLILLIPLAMFLMLALGGMWLFLGAVVAWGVVPIIDWLVGDDASNYTPEEEANLAKSRYYDLVLRVAVPSYWVVLLAVLLYASTQSLAWWEVLGLTWSMGSFAGLMMNVGHELGHRHNVYDKWLGKGYLHLVGYGHFVQEHNKGHHANVATPLDPSSAHKGQSLYAFLCTAITGSYKEAFRLEFERMERLGLPKWHFKNEMWVNLGLPLILLLLVWSNLGPVASLVFVGQALGGVLTLEVVNYIEHYGLRRKLLENGRYERTSPLHSWNNNHLITNALFYQVQRHSDHHAWPNRKYQILRHFDESPQLPYGYPTMMWLAWFPPLWFKVMDPMVDRYNAKTAQIDSNGYFFGTKNHAS